MRINIIFPVLNEQYRINRGINETVTFMRANISMPFELNIVDNGSIDKTEEYALKLCEKYPEVHYTKITERGLGVAFREGFKRNNSDIVGYMDIDLATNLNHLIEVEKLFKTQPDIDLINGSRFNRKSKVMGRKWYRNISSYGLIFMLKVFLKMKATDSICGFKFFRKESASRLISMSSTDENGWFYIIELLLRAERNQFKIHELPVEWFDDTQSKVKIMETITNYIRNIYKLSLKFKKKQI